MIRIMDRRELHRNLKYKSPEESIGTNGKNLALIIISEIDINLKNAVAGLDLRRRDYAFLRQVLLH
jgi:hypothetical protein